jgi:hypothetical protein
LISKEKNQRRWLDNRNEIGRNSTRNERSSAARFWRIGKGRDD